MNKILENSIPTSKFRFERTGHTVKNRSVLAAMTNKQSFKNGNISNTELKWLLRRAEGGFGIITTAAIHVSKSGQGWDGEIGLFSDNNINGLKNLTSQIKNHDGLIFAQLFHGGLRSPQRLTGMKPLSSSINKTDCSNDGYSFAASESDIKEIIQDFSQASMRAVKSGFDGIEIHCAHGYLLSQFLGSNTNRRTDKWGGSLKARSRLIIEIIKAIKKVVPRVFIIGIRISPEIKEMGIDLMEMISFIKKIRKFKLDFIHISCWDVYSTSNIYTDKDYTLTEWFTKSIKNLPPVISTGNIWSTNDAVNILKQGASLFGVAKAAIPYPDLPEKMYDPNFDPYRGPFSYDDLRNKDLGDVFINYLKLWKDFIID